MTDRTTYLGGSDAAAALGLSPWETPLHLYLEKRGELPPPGEPERKRQRLLDRGKREEPNIVDDLIELHGIEVTKRSTRESPNRYVDPSLPFLAAEIDFEWRVTEKAVVHLSEYIGVDIPKDLIGTIQNGEVKTAHPFVAQKKFGEEGTDEIPIEYGAQALHGLGVTSRALTLFAVGVYVDDPLLYLVRADADTIGNMRTKMAAFWREHVLAGVPPEPVNLPDVYMMFGKKRAVRREATDMIAAHVKALEGLRAREATVKEGIEAVKYEIGAYLVGGEEFDDPKAKVGTHILTYKGVPIQQLTLERQEERLNVELVKTKFPEVAAQCVKPISFYKFSKPRKGSR